MYVFIFWREEFAIVCYKNLPTWYMNLNIQISWKLKLPWQKIGDMPIAMIKKTAFAMLNEHKLPWSHKNVLLPCCKQRNLPWSTIKEIAMLFWKRRVCHRKLHKFTNMVYESEQQNSWELNLPWQKIEHANMFFNFSVIKGKLEFFHVFDSKSVGKFAMIKNKFCEKFAVGLNKLILNLP